MSHKPILCLDFDGVIHSYVSGWKGPRNIPDPPVPGAIEFLAEAVEHFEVHIYSSRSHYWLGRLAMWSWLNRQVDNYGGGVWVEGERMMKQIKWPKHKPPAMITIDDRALTRKDR